MTKPAVYSLTGKVGLITGAGRGLGASLARELVSRGARVALLDVAADAVAREASALPDGTAIGVACDVTDRASLANAVALTVEAFGGIDIVVANAGVLGRSATFRALDPEDVASVLNVNVNGVVNTVSAALDEVIRHSGQVVFVSSVFAYVNGAAAVPYAMSKAAVAQLGRGVAVELAPHEASALTAYFALIDTDMIHDGIDADPDVSAVLALTPRPLLKRIQSVEAARAIADGLEARARAVSLPRRWRPIAALQGILGPLSDTKLVRDPAMHAALTRLEQQRLQPTQGAE